VGFAYMVEVLLIARGGALLILSIRLLNKFKELRLGLKITTITMSVFGIHTILIGLVAIFPSTLQVLPHGTTMFGINFFKYSLPFIYIFLFGSLFWSSKMGFLLKM